MSDAFTAALRLCKPEDGGDEGTWAPILNNQTIDMIDEAVGGYVAVSVASGDVTLSANNGTTDQARNAVIKFTGSPGTNRTVTAPVVEKTYWLINGVGDSSSILFKAAGGSTVTIPAGCIAKVYTDGTTTAVILFLYGEGSFTPTPAFAGGNTAMTTSVAYGKWTRIGDRVFIDLQVLHTAKGSSTGAYSIGGFPFTSRNTANARFTFGVYPDALTGVAGGIVALMAHNATAVALYQTATGTTAALDDTKITDTSRFVLTGSYGV